jgi:hypothetical protein
MVAISFSSLIPWLVMLIVNSHHTCISFIPASLSGKQTVFNFERWNDPWTVWDLPVEVAVGAFAFMEFDDSSSSCLLTNCREAICSHDGPPQTWVRAESDYH